MHQKSNMNRPSVRLALSGLVVALMLTVVGCQGYQDGTRRTIGEFTDDVAIQSRVKLALINDPDIEGLRINIEVKRGDVTLHGNVSSHELKRRALELAGSVKGVTKVEDRLTVVTD